jgi:FkbM family methyltransferase
MLLDLLRKRQDVPLPRLVVVDVGAMPEGTVRYAPLLDHDCASVVGFEPQAEQLARLQAASPPTHTYLPHILGKGGPARFHRTRYPGCSSLYEPDPRVIDLFSTIGAAGPGGNFHVVETSEVQTCRLDEIAGIAPPDLLKLDVQGAELDVLEGGTETVSRALVIEAEVEFVPLYRDQPLFGDVQRFLRGHGFLLHKLIDVGGRGFAPMTSAPNPYLPVSQLLWADAVFVRDFSDLARYGDEDLLKASVILDEVYRSYDLCAYLLAEHDRRSGSGLAAAYLAELPRAERPTLVLNLRDAP